jgi:N-acetylglucosaminyl-diphospho-decaprenol L-rhamnosyltransferase
VRELGEQGVDVGRVVEPVWVRDRDGHGVTDVSRVDDEGGIWASLITVTYNSDEALRRFWSLPEGLPAGVEWIVVDNGSVDDSVELARNAGARVISLARNRGFSAANNAGLSAARGSFIGFVNPDVAVGFGDLEMLAEAARSERMLVAPQLLNDDGSRQPNGRGFPYLWHKVMNRLGRESALEGGYLLFGDDRPVRPVVWFMGAAVFGWRADIERTGAWDPHFFLYYEDKDICLRAWRAGLGAGLVPAAAWVHGWARETTGFRWAPWRREIASMIKFYARYPEFLLPRGVADRKHPRVRTAVYGEAS